MTTESTTSTQSEATAQGVLAEIIEVWPDYLEEEGQDRTAENFAEACKGWYDNQMQEVHDSAGDDEYQQAIIAGLRIFKTMFTGIQSYDFGMQDMEAEIAEDTDSE
jgi:hypothetical protein